MANSSTRATTARLFRSLSNRLGTALIVMVGLSVTATAAPLHCAEQLRVEQTAVDLPAGLQAFDSAVRHVWVNVLFSDGSPVQQAWLAPTRTHYSRKSFTNVWRFTPSAAGTWLACGYSGTSVVTAFRLADTVSVCEVRYDTNVSPPAATGIDCR
jgi:hypothetical protein